MAQNSKGRGDRSWGPSNTSKTDGAGEVQRDVKVGEERGQERLDPLLRRRAL